MTLSFNPLDAVPPEGWLLLVLATVALRPAAYAWRYLTHGRQLRDITQPPEDLSWKSKPQLYRSLAVLIGLLGAGVFIVSPQAEQFAKSDWFAPTLLGAVGTYALGTVIPGWRNRKVEPLLNGISRAFRRDEEPRRYWASLTWNTAVGLALVGASLDIGRDILTPGCDDPDTEDVAVLIAALSTCNAMLAEPGLKPDERMVLSAGRGRVNHRLGRTEQAIRDYSDAIALDPKDSYSLYNRGELLFISKRYEAAIRDFDASLALRPDNDDAYLYRGFARARLGRYALAERDFVKLPAEFLHAPNALAQRADFAIERGDFEVAIRLASQALERDPKNTYALRLRAEAYWKMGEEGLSQADDGRVRAIEGNGP